MNKKEYLEVASRRKGTDSAAFDLDMPSGAVWRVLPISLEPYIMMGRLPMHLIADLKSVQDIQNQADELATKLSGSDIVNMYSVVRDVMLTNVIEPKISLTPSEDALSPDEILPEDFIFFRNFVLSGGQARLNSFRKSDNGSDNAPDRKASGDSASDAGPNGQGDAQGSVADTIY